MYGQVMFDDNLPQPVAINEWQAFPREAGILKSLMDDTHDAIAEFDGIVAGGAITSVFNNTEVNDFDLYFPDAEKASRFVAALWTKEYGYHQFINCSDKSMTFVQRSSDVKCQLIYYKFFPTCQDIFNDFDFTVNMGAYSPKTGLFNLHPDFLRHNSQRTIQINPNTAYPLISVLRTAKYKERGYHTSKPQLMKLLLAISKLNLSSWKEVEEQVGGMYGYNTKDIFPVDKEYNVDAAIACLDAISPRKLEQLDAAQLDWDTIQKAVVGIFPEEFQKLPDNSWAYKFKDALENYAFPDDESPKQSVWDKLDEKMSTDKVNSNDLPF
jgi:hypothetical protein